MKKVLAILGSNFLGHVTNMLPITSFLQQHGFVVDFIVIPLSKIEDPPIVKFLKGGNIKFKYVDLFASRKTPQNVFSYLDLLYTYDFYDVDKIRSYYQFVEYEIVHGKYDMVISDFVFFVSIICKTHGIKHVAIRSHALKVSSFQNKPIELFNWWDDMPLETQFKINDIWNLFVETTGVESFENTLYGDITVTPGFAPLDDRFPEYGEHFFVTEKREMPSSLLPERDAYLYIRDPKKLYSVIQSLDKINKTYYIIDSNLANGFVNIWDSKPQTKLIISHGGHGMCIWSVQNKIYHLLLPDNNDRISNAKRIKKLGYGDFFLTINDLDSFLLNADCFGYSHQLAETDIIDNSISFYDFSNYLLTKF